MHNLKKKIIAKFRVNHRARNFKTKKIIEFDSDKISRELATLNPLLRKPTCKLYKSNQFCTFNQFL